MHCGCVNRCKSTSLQMLELNEGCMCNRHQAPLTDVPVLAGLRNYIQDDHPWYDANSYDTSTLPKDFLYKVQTTFLHVH
eukprot:3858472-Amphidinium_carterae.1